MILDLPLALQQRLQTFPPDLHQWSPCLLLLLRCRHLDRIEDVKESSAVMATSEPVPENLDKKRLNQTEQGGRNTHILRFNINPSNDLSRLPIPGHHKVSPLVSSNVPPCKLSIEQLPKPLIPVLCRSLKFLLYFKFDFYSPKQYEVSKGMGHRFQIFYFAKLEKCRWCIQRRLLLWLIGRWASDLRIWRIFPWLRRGQLPSVNEVDGEEEELEIVWRFPERRSWLRA